MGIQAFNPLGNTTAFTVNSSGASTAVQPLPNGASSSQYRIVVPQGTNTVFLGVGANATVAQTNAAVLNAGSNAATYVLLPGSDLVLTLPPASFFSGITSAGSTTVYICPGDGV